MLPSFLVFAGAAGQLLSPEGNGRPIYAFYDED
jgi:hypothetical protein